MKRREFIGTAVRGAATLGAAASMGAAAPLGAQGTAPTVTRKGRIKQALWRTTFGDKSPLSFDQMCREAARLGCVGFDMIAPDDWPTLRKHGLRPTLGVTGGVDFPNGIIHPEVHSKIEAALRPHIDLCAKNDVKTFISVGGQRRGMEYERAADNAAAFLNRIKSQLEDRQINIAVENMNNRRTDPRFGREDQVFGHWAWGVGVCERVNSPNVKLVCDIYHLQIMDGDVVEHIKASHKWIAHFHVAGVPSRNEIDGTQELNYRYIAEVIAGLPGWTGYVSHEWRPAPGRDVLTSIADAVALMDV
jgi:hydroxypyruvate isomerase